MIRRARDDFFPQRAADEVFICLCGLTSQRCVDVFSTVSYSLSQFDVEPSLKTSGGNRLCLLDRKSQFFGFFFKDLDS